MAAGRGRFPGSDRTEAAPRRRSRISSLGAARTRHRSGLSPSELSRMSVRGDLVNPIPGPNPAGIDLRYDPLYDKIKEARHEDDDAPQGDWQRARKTADFGLVTKLAGDALATRSKDLQLAAWLTEAQLRREGFAGLRDGLELLAGLLRDFWNELYPPLEDGDAELR